MMTIVTFVTVKDGMAPEWDSIMRERFEAAKGQPGWIGGQLLMPVDSLTRRGIIGSWETRADWERWHSDEAFVETRRRLADIQEGPGEDSWHEVIVDARP